jgi:aquaporin Z
MIVKQMLTEFIGTFIFLGVIIATGEAFPIGLALATAIFFGGKISGGHYNPAVSFMMYLNKAINIQQLFVYVLAQVLGGVAVLFFLKSKIINF